jgi:acyl-coenzyme A synthetase/AMP-(fatty) acid ligase
VIRAAGGIHEVAVVARPDKVYGEVTVAYVVLSEEARAERDSIVAAIQQHCEKSLAKFKVPRAINVLPELPKIGNNKIHRPALRDMARADADQMKDLVAKSA